MVDTCKVDVESCPKPSTTNNDAVAERKCVLQSVAECFTRVFGWPLCAGKSDFGKAGFRVCNISRCKRSDAKPIWSEIRIRCRWLRCACV